MKKKKTRNYRCYKGVLHTFGENGSSIYHKRIYYRYATDEMGHECAREILTGRMFPTSIGILLGINSNVDNFVSGSTEVFDNEVDEYLNRILFDQRIFQKEVDEILFYKEGNTKKKIKM